MTERVLVDLELAELGLAVVGRVELERELAVAVAVAVLPHTSSKDMKG